MKRICLYLLYLFACSVTVCSVVTHASTVVFDNFGVGDTYLFDSGFNLTEGEPIGYDFDEAFSFIPAVGGILTDIWLAVGLSEGPNVLDVWIMSDSGGKPGSIIEAFEFSDEMGPFGSNNPPLHKAADRTTELVAGTQYWLVASAPGPDVMAVWNANSIDDSGLFANRTNGGTWVVNSNATRGAFRVSVFSCENIMQGDINNDGVVNLQDEILSLQVISGLFPTMENFCTNSIVGGNGKISIEDAIYILQEIAGYRK